MSKNKPLIADPKGTDSWLRQNVIDVAPLWAQFIQTAFANVRIEMNKRQPNGCNGADVDVAARRRHGRPRPRVQDDTPIGATECAIRH